VLLAVIGSLAWTAAWTAEHSTSIGELLTQHELGVDRTITIAGKIAVVNPDIEFRGAMPIATFMINDGTGLIQVAARYSVVTTLQPGYEVEVTGKFNKIPKGYEIDASEGTITIASATPSSARPTPSLQTQPDFGGVPTQPIETTWSLAVGASSLVAAGFGVIAVLQVITLLRRFNVGLRFVLTSPVQIDWLPDNAHQRIVVPVRLFPTGKLPPVLDGNISLHVNSHWAASDTRIIDTNPRMNFPAAVQGEIDVLIESIVSRSNFRDHENSLVLIFKDLFSGKRFKFAIGMDEALRRLQPHERADNAVGETPNTSSPILSS
jgi:hypothetical protein